MAAPSAWLFAVVTDLTATVVDSVERPLPSRDPDEVIAAITEVTAGFPSRPDWV